MLPVDLWHGVVSEFIRSAGSGALAGDMAGRFVNLHGVVPGMGELRSWENSLSFLADAVRPLAGRDVGVFVGSPGGLSGPPASTAMIREREDGPPAVALEYHLPLSGKRIDVLFTGTDRSGQPWSVVLELKQWSRAWLDDAHATNVRCQEKASAGDLHPHPSEQAADYADWLGDYHSAFVEEGVKASPAAWCHNLEEADAAALLDARFADLLERSPLFLKGQQDGLAAHIGARVGAGGGARVLDRILGASFHPGPRVLDSLEQVLEARREWHLLDEQRVAFNEILAEVRRARAGAGRSVVLVRGAPGTGKTVVAVQLLASALRLEWKAAHATGGKAFTTALRSKFRGAHGLFLWNMSLRTAPTQGLDLLLVDEAHRVRESSDMRFTPRAERGKRSQAEELINAARVAVFLLDENQSVRPDEVGSTDLLRAEAKRLGAKVREFDLEAQFRCGGCAEYLQWVDWLLEFRAERPGPWGARYEVSIVGTPEELEAVVPESRARGETARLVAGFCWEWSAAPADGRLVPDVVIGEWKRPWNEKPGDRPYKPGNHPYTLWADTEVGERQIGCIYSAQGFDFARVGVIWGPDLVRRGGRWVARKEHSFDRPVRSSGDMLKLVRNAYRVLLTRGMRGVRLLILDDETREYVRGALTLVV
ncbi:MAG: DUF2075 domain-containing protein [Planctomycetes bacterium]|nr:DUF2075 domain-containing protein [Planctomycetota bacterium]